jgi:hypothetical protein
MTTLFDTTLKLKPSAGERAGAGLVVDDDRVAQRLGQSRLRGTRDRVHPRAGGIGQDEADALVRLREGGQRRGGRQAGQQVAAGEGMGHRRGLRLFRPPRPGA